MTEKDFHRLRRQDLLQLLLVQGREMAEIKGELAERNTSLATSEAQVERLKDKLNEKDEQIERLKEKLNEKDAQMKDQMERLKEKLNDKDEQIERLKNKLDEKDEQIDTLTNDRRIAQEECGNLAEAALAINKIFETAQKVADQYIYNLKCQVEEKGIPADRLPGGEDEP